MKPKLRRNNFVVKTQNCIGFRIVWHTTWRDDVVWRGLMRMVVLFGSHD